MLTYNQLMQVLADSNVESKDFSLENIQSIYGKNVTEKVALPLVENLVLAVVDFDTPLYDVLAYGNEFEEKLEVAEEYSAICDILNIVINNLPVCKENAQRLFDLAEEVDILNVYNTLMLDFKQFLTAKQIAEIETRAKQTFDNNLILW